LAKRDTGIPNDVAALRGARFVAAVVRLRIDWIDAPAESIAAPAPRRTPTRSSRLPR